MKTLLAALAFVVATACSAPQERHTNYLLDDSPTNYIPDPGEPEESIIGHQLVAGQITEAEALESLEEINPLLFSEDLKEKFFPLDIIVDCMIIGSHDQNPGFNCAYEERYGWNIECDVAGFDHVKCRITISCDKKLSPFYGTWIFTKKCDGKPIGQWTLNGLYVNYDTMQRIW